MSRSETERRSRAVLGATVLRRERISSSFARITLTGECLSHFSHAGFDQWCRMFFPRPGAGRLQLPGASPDAGWYQTYLAAGDEERPWMRYVTVRDWRPADLSGPELDVDVVVHGEPGQDGVGPLAAWAMSVQPGEPVALLDQGPLFRAPEDARSFLLIGDETAVPALAGILASLAPDSHVRVLVEVPDDSDVFELTGPPDRHVSWSVRRSAAIQPGSIVLDKARELLTGTAADYVYAAGETTLARSLDSLLRETIGMDPKRFNCIGYWHWS